MEKVVLNKAEINNTPEGMIAAVEKLLAPLGGMAKFVKPGSCVLVKPNVCVAAPPESAKVTDPKVVLAVVQSALFAGAKEVWVSESCIVGGDTDNNFKAAGYDVFRNIDRVKLIDLKKEKVRQVEVKNAICMKTLNIFERVFEADVIINMPKLKTLASVATSMGMKNLKGLIRDDSKKQCHYNNLNGAIVDINRVIKPDLTIIDGLLGSSMYEPVEHGILLAGERIASLDAVGAVCVGVDPREVKYLCLAEEAGMGSIDVDNIEIVGEKPIDVMKEYKKVQDDVDALSGIYPEITVCAGAACSGCVTVLETLLRSAKTEGWGKPWENKLRLAIGLDAKLPSDELTTLRLGNCLAEGAGDNFIRGCPFINVEVKEWMNNNLIKEGLQ